ncbi:MAG: NAD-dependent epimerase/dehydratase family protein [Herpetosiphonaceae bacterium]|nr:NAD-dependent epimerase/dehydratase family protein [Herpetosiphonaceae bacterium]
MKILVTGAAGFIGSHLAEQLVALGHTVRGVDCFTDYYAPALKQRNAHQLQAKGVSLLVLDLATDDLHEAVRDVDVVFHAAAQPGISATTPFQTYVDNNLTATYRLLQAAQQANHLQGFVYLSTSSVYGADATGSETTEPRPTSWYGVTKLAAEQVVLAAARDHGFPACSLRLFSVYGPRERPDKLYPQLIRCLLEDRPFPLFAGSEHHLRSFTYVGDVIKGFVAVLDNLERCRGEIFNIGSDTAITTGEGIRIVEGLVGKPVHIERRPPRAGDQLKTHATIDKARAILGYEPTTTPQEGLAQEVAWYQAEVWENGCSLLMASGLHSYQQHT